MHSNGLGVLAAAVVLTMAVSGCGDATDAGGEAPESGPTAGPTAGSTVGATSSAPADTDELPPGWDESPDGAPPVPDDQLDDDQLTALLRTRASAPSRAESCRADELDASLAGSDAAAGSRFTTIVVRNTSDRSCVLEGVPGVGVRGTWGSTLRPRVSSGVGAAGPVTLAPGAAARSLLEWGGSLAGAEQERASMIVVQLAAGQVPLRVGATIEGSEDPLDIGMESSIDVAPFEPMS